MPMTYKQLAEHILNDFSEEQKESDVSVFVKAVDEFYPLDQICIAEEELVDVLDDGHPFLMV
jgi:hypothetical protein